MNRPCSAHNIAPLFVGIAVIGASLAAQVPPSASAAEVQRDRDDAQNQRLSKIENQLDTVPYVCLGWGIAGSGVSGVIGGVIDRRKRKSAASTTHHGDDE